MSRPGLPELISRESMTYDSFIADWDIVEELSTRLSKVSPELLLDLFKPVEGKEKRVNALLMNAITYSEMRKWGRDFLEVINDIDEIRHGIMAYMWGALVIVTKKAPTGKIIAVSEDEHKTAATLQLADKKESENDELVKLYDSIKENAKQMNIIASRMGSAADTLFTKLSLKQ